MYEQIQYKDLHAGFESFEDWSLAHKHASYEIFLLTEGEKTIRVANRKYDLKAGDAFLVCPGIDHKYIGEGAYSRYEIIFSDKLLDSFFTSFMKRRLLRCFTSEVVRLTAEEQEKFIALYEEMIRSHKSGEDYPIHLANILCMLNEVSERGGAELIHSEETTKEEAALINVVAYINANHRTIRSMDDIIQACFISKSYLCCIFKNAYGMTVMEYLRKVRIRSACTFLSTTDKNLSLIARKLGFVDLSHFTKVFKNEMNMTPKEYREMKKKERENRDL